MILTVKTTMSFDSTREQEKIKKFEETNDLTEWKKEESTVLTTFTRTDVFGDGIEQTEEWKALIGHDCKECTWSSKGGCTIPCCDYEPIEKREEEA